MDLLHRIRISFISNVHGIIVRDGHGGGGSRKINAWHIYTLMVYVCYPGRLIVSGSIRSIKMYGWG